MITSKLASYVTMESFGLLRDGKQAFCLRLQNNNGIELTVTNFGATITSLKIPQPNGQKRDVVLGFSNVGAYEQSFELPSPPYLGAIVGRYAGRIRHSCFELNGELIQLNANLKTHHLHGGKSSFANALWKIIEVNNNENPSVTLQYVSADGEENYPGELICDVTYTLTESNAIEVVMKATSSKDTVVNLTQHTYFNLEGHDATLNNQTLLVNANQILETDADNLPTGNFKELDGHYLDFRMNKPLPNSIDDTFVLNQHSDAPAAILTCLNSKLSLSVTTNQPGLHIYIGGNCFGEIVGKENVNYNTKSGICFETEYFQDAPNIPHFPSALLKKNEIYLHKTTFKILGL